VREGRGSAPASATRRFFRAFAHAFARFLMQNGRVTIVNRLHHCATMASTPALRRLTNAELRNLRVTTRRKIRSMELLDDDITLGAAPVESKGCNTKGSLQPLVLDGPDTPVAPSIDHSTPRYDVARTVPTFAASAQTASRSSKLRPHLSKLGTATVVLLFILFRRSIFSSEEVESLVQVPTIDNTPSGGAFETGNGSAGLIFAISPSMLSSMESDNRSLHSSAVVDSVPSVSFNHSAVIESRRIDVNVTRTAATVENAPAAAPVPPLLDTAVPVAHPMDAARAEPVPVDQEEDLTAAGDPLWHLYGSTEQLRLRVSERPSSGAFAFTSLADVIVTVDSSKLRINPQHSRLCLAVTPERYASGFIVSTSTALRTNTARGGSVQGAAAGATATASASASAAIDSTHACLSPAATAAYLSAASAAGSNAASISSLRSAFSIIGLPVLEHVDAMRPLPEHGNVFYSFTLTVMDNRGRMQRVLLQAQGPVIPAGTLIVQAAAR
jgi:hypothetical protein